MNYVCYRHPHSVAPWFFYSKKKEKKEEKNSNSNKPNGVEKIVIIFILLGKKWNKHYIRFHFDVTSLLNVCMCFLFHLSATSWMSYIFISFTFLYSIKEKKSVINNT